MTRYLLNSAVLTAFGRWDYAPIAPEEARRWFYGERSRFADQPIGSEALPAPISTIGYAETAAALSELLGATIAVDRRSIRMAPGDEALVFRLVFPPGSPRIAPGDKGALGAHLLAGHYELGLLTRLS